MTFELRSEGYTGKKECSSQNKCKGKKTVMAGFMEITGDLRYRPMYGSGSI